MLKRPNKDSVLAKHKKWLHELQKTKDRLEEQYLDEAKKKEEAQQKVSIILPVFISFLHLYIF
jgi:hypothetical protein